ncbi:MAG: sigma-70 family RNA polymerase sigma factor [Candidatus Moranbacteria bacterium]|nr:sigma-70 family RNA polymerase sigma factor [Candidatus Moranbacteria bacterium]
MSFMETADTLNKALNSSLGVFLISDPSGTALYANLATEKRTGFSVGEIIGKAPGKLWGGQMPRAFYNKLWATIGEKQIPFVATVTNVRKDKARYPELMAIAPIIGKGKKTPDYFIAFEMSHLEGKAPRERFEREFQKVFSKKGALNDEDRLRYILQTLGSKHAAPRMEGKSLPEIFRETLVGPFEERFRARKVDHELILAAQTDPKQFQALYNKYRHTIFVYFMRHAEGNIEIAEDLAQDTFYRALRYLENFRLTNASYGTYLLRVAHNVLINYFRKKQFLSIIDETILDKVTPEVCQLSEDTLWQSPSLLTTERKVLSMKYQEGFSIHEIATMLGKSENAVKLHLSRARKKLRNTLIG